LLTLRAGYPPRLLSSGTVRDLQSICSQLTLKLEGDCRILISAHRGQWFSSCYSRTRRVTQCPEQSLCLCNFLVDPHHRWILRSVAIQQRGSLGLQASEITLDR